MEPHLVCPRRIARPTRSRRRRALAGVVGAGAAVVLLSACSPTDAAGPGLHGKKVALVTCTDSNPWCNTFNKQIDEELSSRGVDVTTLTSNFDAAQSSRQFSQALSQHPDEILYYVNDPEAAVANYARAQQAGVPVVVVDTVVGKEAHGQIAAALQPDHAALGKFAAQNLQEGLKKEGVTSGKIVAITGTSTQLTTQVRMKAFRKQLATTPQYKLVEVQDGNWDPIKSATIASQLFAKYGNNGIQGIYGMADYQAAAIAQAAQQAGVPLYPASAKGLVITGSNCAPTGVSAIRAGKVYGGATQAPAVEARQYMPYITKVLDGKNLSAQGSISVPVARITRANLKKYAGVCTY